MLRKRLWTALLALAAVVGMAGGALAAAVDVSTETDLKNALDETYDTINVRADIALNETLSITRSVTLNGNGHILSLDMGKFGSVVKITRPDENSRIIVSMDRFIITGGRTTNDDCAGMYVGDGVTATVNNCRFSGNNSSGYGGGMCVDGDTTVTNCTFSDNMASWCGGGMYVGSYATATVSDCTFSGNTGGSGSGGGGGGMCVRYTDDSTVTVTDCTFSDNRTSDDGGGMLVDGSNVTVANCIFTDNNASYNGGGMSFRSAQNNVTLNVTNCTFSGNSASGSSAHGGGMDASSNGGETTINMANCTFVGNSASYDGGGMYIGAGVTTTNVTNCTFADNSTSSNGGGLYAGDRTIATVANCTFVSNKALTGSHELYVDNGLGLLTAVNTIFWNSGQYIFNKGDMAFYNCAYGSGAINGTLNNSSANNIDTLDWSGHAVAREVEVEGVKHTVIPLKARDEALRNKGTSSIAGNATLTALIPQNDQLGNPRSGNPDIGAMEHGSIPLLDVELLGDKTLDVIYGEGGTLKLGAIVSWDYKEVKTLEPGEYELKWSTASEDLSSYDLDFSDGTLTVGAKTGAGTYNIPITAKASSGDIPGTADATVTVTVNKVKISNARVNFGDDFTINGTVNTAVNSTLPAPTVTLGSSTLTSGTDYTLSWDAMPLSNDLNVNANGTVTGTPKATVENMTGVAYCKVTGVGNYTGTASGTLIMDINVSSKPTVTLMYDESATKPTVKADDSTQVTFTASPAADILPTVDVVDMSIAKADVDYAKGVITVTVKGLKAGTTTATLKFESRDDEYNAPSDIPLNIIVKGDEAGKEDEDNKVDISNATLSFPPFSVSGVVGKPISASLPRVSSVIVDLTTLKEDVDYTFAWGDEPLRKNGMYVKQGELSGTPTEAETTEFRLPFTLTGIGNYKGTKGGTYVLDIPISADSSSETPVDNWTLNLSPAKLDDITAKVGTAITPVTLTAIVNEGEYLVSNDKYALSWSVDPTLPSGLTFANGILSGTPTASAAAATYTLKATASEKLAVASLAAEASHGKTAKASVTVQITVSGSDAPTSDKGTEETEKTPEQKAADVVDSLNGEAKDTLDTALNSSNEETKKAAEEVGTLLYDTLSKEEISELKADDVKAAVENKKQETEDKKQEDVSKAVADTKVPAATDLLADSDNTALKDASKELSVQPKVVEPEVAVESKDEIASTLGVPIETDITIDSADKELSKQTEAVESLFNEISADLASADNSTGGKGVVIVTVFPRMRPYATGFFPLRVNLRHLTPGRRLKFWPSVSYFKQKASGKAAAASVSLAAGTEGDFYLLDENGNKVEKVTGNASNMTMVPFLTAGKEYSDAFITADATEKDQETLQKLAENAGSGGTDAPTSDKDGGGCDAGLGFAGVVALAGLALLKKKSLSA